MNKSITRTSRSSSTTVRCVHINCQTSIADQDASCCLSFLITTTIIITCFTLYPWASTFPASLSAEFYSISFFSSHSWLSYDMTLWKIKKGFEQYTILIIFRVLFVTDVLIAVVCMTVPLFLLLLLHMATHSTNDANAYRFGWLAF